MRKTNEEWSRYYSIVIWKANLLLVNFRVQEYFRWIIEILNTSCFI